MQQTAIMPGDQVIFLGHDCDKPEVTHVTKVWGNTHIRVASPAAILFQRAGYVVYEATGRHCYGCERVFRYSDDRLARLNAEYEAVQAARKLREQDAAGLHN